MVLLRLSKEMPKFYLHKFAIISFQILSNSSSFTPTIRPYIKYLLPRTSEFFVVSSAIKSKVKGVKSSLCLTN
jgi:hypothetical protein